MNGVRNLLCLGTNSFIMYKHYRLTCFIGFLSKDIKIIVDKAKADEHFVLKQPGIE